MENIFVNLMTALKTIGVIFLTYVLFNPQLKKKYLPERSFKQAIIIVSICIVIAILIAWILSDLMERGYIPSK